MRIFKSKYAIDLCFLYFYRSFKDGLQLIDFQCFLDYDKEIDHNPQFVLYLVILNFMIFDLCIYNIHHAE